MSAKVELVFNWSRLREDVRAYRDANGLTRPAFVYTCDIDITQLGKIESFATNSGALALMTLYKICSLLDTTMETYIIDNRLK